MATSSLKSSLRTAVSILAAVVMSMLFVAVPGAEASHDAEPVSGNPTCATLLGGEDWNEYKIEGQGGGGDNEVATGTYTDPDGPLEVKVTVSETDDGWVLAWDANIGVDAVFVKGGDTGGHLYRYDPEATSDTGLHAPENPSEKYAGLSHISFCYDVEDQPADIGLSVDKVNDASGDNSFSNAEEASGEGAAVPFRVTIANSDSDAPVVLDAATDTFADSELSLFDQCDNLAAGQVLAVGESVTCTFTLVDYAPAPGESLANVVTVEGHEVDNPDNPTDAEDDSTVTTASQEGPAAISLTVDKVNNADGDDDFTDDETAPAEGADVPFSVAISNPADSDAAVVLDSATDAFGDTEVDLFDECDNLSDSTALEPGDSVTCTFTLADYAPAAGESLDNLVTVEGHEQDNPDNTTSADDDSTVDTEEDEVLGDTDERDEPTEAAQQPGIAVDKVALVSPGAAGAMTVTYVPDDGDDETVAYRYRITNTGDTTLDQVQLTDDVLGTVELADTTLEPGESTTATATHVVTEADAEAGRILNVATAVGTAPDGEQVNAVDDALVLVEAVQPAVEAADEQVDQAPAEDQLPATGADPVGWSTLAIGLLVVGAAALLVTRQRATA